MKSETINSRLSWLKLAAVLAGAFIFQDLFWEGSFGLNLTLYVAAITLLLPLFYPYLLVFRSFLLVAAGTLFATGMVAINNSDTSKFAVFASFLLMLGLANQPQLRLLLNAAANGITNLMTGVKAFFAALLQLRSQGCNWKRGWYYFKLAGIPVLALLVFHVMFSVANERYNKLAGIVANAISDALLWLVPEFMLGRIVLLVVGLLVSAGSLYIVPQFFLRELEDKKRDTISRQRGYTDSVSRFLLSFRDRLHLLPDLKKEYLSAVLLVGLVNLLLLGVNIIDINWLWFGFRPTHDYVPSQFVHEGTYVLIGSILLAMAIVLFYFRGNLNFYQGNKLLKVGAYIWIVQNAVLVISVGLRNYYYIYYCGLAYKRIGVVIFLLLTLFGLITIYLKIRDRKSLFFLLRTNTLAAYIMMLIISAINWDPLIARVNIKHAHSKSIDFDFLLSLSDKALPVLYHNEIQLGPSTEMAIYPFKPHREYLHTRVRQFLSDYENQTWRTWNHADAKAYQYLKANYKPGSISQRAANKGL